MGAVPKIKDFDRTSSLAASFALSCEKYPRKVLVYFLSGISIKRETKLTSKP